MDTLSLTRQAKIYNGEKTATSITGAGKTRELCVKKKIKKNKKKL